MTRTLLIGSGAREHIIASVLARSPEIELFAAMSSHNPGIMKLAEGTTTTQISNPQKVADYADRMRIELAVVGPEAPLVSGVVDTLTKNGVRCVGPTKQLASLEGDKCFCRKLLNEHNIAGNPQFRILTNIEEAESFLRTAGPVAIKPVGLTGGKGVKVSGEDLPDKQAEIAYAREVFRNRIGGEKLLVEERLEGEEFSVQAFVDGADVYVMPAVQDHKRAYDDDSGPNTGGMGSYSDSNHLLPFLSNEDLATSSSIMRDVVRALQKETGEAYRGILYGQFMLSRGLNEHKPTAKLIEFNCRFGDPEAMNVLTLLTPQTNFLDICERITEGTLKPKHFSFLNKATVCKYLVPTDYPDNGTAQQPFTVHESALKETGVQAYYAGVDVKGERTVTTSSRTLALVAMADSIPAAEQIVETATKHVHGPLRHRHDIGTLGLIQKRIQHMQALRENRTPLPPLEAGLS